MPKVTLPATAAASPKPERCGIGVIVITGVWAGERAMSRLYPRLSYILGLLEINDTTSTRESCTYTLEIGKYLL